MEPKDWIQLVGLTTGFITSTAFITSRFTKVETKLDDHIASDEKTHTRLEAGQKEQGEQIRAIQIFQGGKR